MMNLQGERFLLNSKQTWPLGTKSKSETSGKLLR